MTNDIAPGADKAYYVSSHWTTKPRWSVFATEKAALKKVREYRLISVRVGWKNIIGNVGPSRPAINRLESLHAYEAKRSWLDPIVGRAPGAFPVSAPDGLTVRAQARSWSIVDGDEYQVYITSTEKPREPELIGYYKAEAEARAQIADIDATKTFRVRSWSPPGGPERTGVSCHLAKVHTRYLAGSDRAITS